MLGNRLQSSDHGKHKQIEVCIWIGLHFQLNACLKSLMQNQQPPLHRTFRLAFKTWIGRKKCFMSKIEFDVEFSQVHCSELWSKCNHKEQLDKNRNCFVKPRSWGCLKKPHPPQIGNFWHHCNGVRANLFLCLWWWNETGSKICRGRPSGNFWSGLRWWPSH